MTDTKTNTDMEAKIDEFEDSVPMEFRFKDGRLLLNIYGESKVAYLTKENLVAMLKLWNDNAPNEPILTTNDKFAEGQVRDLRKRLRLIRTFAEVSREHNEDMADVLVDIARDLEDPY